MTEVLLLVPDIFAVINAYILPGYIKSITGSSNQDQHSVRSSHHCIYLARCEVPALTVFTSCIGVWYQPSPYFSSFLLLCLNGKMYNSKVEFKFSRTCCINNTKTAILKLSYLTQ